MRHAEITCYLSEVSFGYYVSLYDDAVSKHEMVDCWTTPDKDDAEFVKQIWENGTLNEKHLSGEISIWDELEV